MHFPKVIISDHFRRSLSPITGVSPSPNHMIVIEESKSRSTITRENYT